MAVPKDLQQFSVGKARRVIVDLNNFGVIADVAVIRILGQAAAIPYSRPGDAINDPEPGFDAPESPQAESGCLKIGRRFQIDRRQFHW
jgi:hypothetical protein